MKKLNLFLLLLCGLFVACSTESPEPEVNKPESNDTEVSFKAYIQQATRATETAFEKDDAISVFAVEPSANISLEASGNYADNIKYVYNGSTFVAASNAIKFDDSYEEGLAYFAIYPYSYSASSKYTFSVKNDQSTLENYTASDLCIAYNEPTTDDTVLLEFNHCLSNVVIKFQGSNLASKNISVELSDVYTSCDVDVNANTYKAKGNKQNVVMGEESGNTFHAIIVPQTVSADDTFMIVTVGGKEIALSLNQTTEFKSGRKITYEYEIQDDKIVAINGYINPWNSEEEVQNSFEQSLYTSTYEKGEAYPYNSLFFDWVGKNVKSLKYRLYKTSTLSGYTDSEIINNLGDLDDAGIIAEINNGGAVSYYFSDLDASTSYTLCTYVTFANGDTKFVKSACSTEASPSNNKFVQSLYASNDYADSGYHNYDCLYLNWEGSSVKRVQFSLFISEVLSGVSDSVIKDNLSREADSEAIYKINNGGVSYRFVDLDSDTSYTLCTLVTFNDGQQTLYKTEASTAEIPEEERLEAVVPEEILEKLDDYIPIYNGMTPPNIEGCYLLEPFVTVYCEDYGYGGYEPGKVVNSCYLEFSNQNTKKNTLDYYEENVSGTSWNEGKGAFISGNGNNFTAFFNTTGETSGGIYIKEALVLSGTKTSSGIKNLYYAFVMVEKGADPNGEVMAEGIFRVFKDQDGMSYSTTRASVVYDDCEYTMVGRLK